MPYTTEDKIAFIKSLYCPAKAVAAETGCSWELILAQAAQEVGWGEKVLPGTNNIFNIKADSSWKGETKTFHVWEMKNGKKIWVDDPFRVYPDIKAALRDRVAFLSSNSRYRKAGLFDEGVKGSLEKEAQALQKAGYATDPNYASSLAAVFRGATMQRAIREAEKQGCCQETSTGEWVFPFPDPEGKEIQDGGVYTGSPSLAGSALARADDGFYPVGASGIWHGGIHFDAGTGTLLKQWEGVRCIKDGEVVAYRVNKKYPEIIFHPSENKAAYSTGFTLVRHKLEIPKSATLVFYSLYMHQLDYEGYTQNPKLPRPSYWAEPKEYTVGTKAKDQQESAPDAEPVAEAEPAEELELDDMVVSDFACWSEDVC
jgi:hypothetical protein